MLKCYRILDLTNEKGFFCGKLLGDLGADVIKIEKPGGDSARRIGPFYHDIPDPEKSLYWFAFNANKRGITLDIETSDGQEIFKELIKKADVVIESFTPGYMDKIGLGYPVLSQINPGIIMTSISDFGQEGPYRDYNASDIVVWALSGLMYVEGDSDRPPLAPSYPHAYLLGAAHGAIGTMVALCHRQITGYGQQVDAPVQQGVIFAANVGTQSAWALTRVIPTRTGRNWWRVITKDGSVALPLLWECKDGTIAYNMRLGLGSGKANNSLVEWMRKEGIDPGVLGRWDWDTQDWNNYTVEDAKGVAEALGKLFSKYTKAELLKIALDKEIQLVACLTPKEQLNFPQFVERKFFIEVQHPELDTSITYPGGFAKPGAGDCRIRFRAPLIGEHNDEIFKRELGMSTGDLLVLKQSGVI